jgi:hypothetical protein
MRAALIFLPQWDPRQPPLAPAILAGVMQRAGADTRVFDLNVALYRHLLQSTGNGEIGRFLLQKLLDPKNLADAQNYLRISQEAQKIFDSEFDPTGRARLFWDACGGLPSVNSSAGWKTAAEQPEKLPFIRHLDKELAEIMRWAPEFIGFSIISDTQLPAALALAAFIHKHLPAAKIVFGGDAVTYRRSLLADQGWLGSIIDAVCLGDGEPFVAAAAAGMSPAGSPNSLSWEVARPGRGVQQSLHDFSKSNPADFSALPLHDYLTPHLVMPVETARGCPWGRCAFCIHPVRAASGRPLYRPRSMAAVTEEIETLFAAGHRRFFIVDEALPPARLRELAEIFAALPEPVFWIGYARLDAGHTCEGFLRARASGCLKLFIGLETGSDRILARFNKGVDQAQARRVLLDAAAAGLAVHIFLMTGFPGEDASDRQATLDLLADVWPAFDPFGVSFDLFALTGELETEMAADPAAFGWEGPKFDGCNDLAWQFPLLTGSAAVESLAEFRARLHSLADRVLGREFGLRHAALAQDSLHLLLLEAKTSLRRP